ncbi:hypothetical protein GPECTOR_9g569 [Gonium pectorale]|uniref:Fanconi-associated nuclease n=1 Tax=Gonium pectorale TaxID=33097 RepID=A0A150GRQ7_GONPE|nr:hypothetical protein GPECTOR_9g569 [Gonium pectorale]|eukprot:KXZ52525.1 hypothetical protein GPECTOR_9g569 [Gonium pectorale]
MAEATTATAVKEAAVLMASVTGREGVIAALAAAAAAAASASLGGGATGGPAGPAAAAGEVLRANLAVIAEDVRRHDGHLLSGEEAALLDRLLGLPPGPACLFLRLALRKGPWFALAAIAYTECGDAAEAAEVLLAAGLAERPQPEDWPQVAALLPVAEVRSLAKGAPPLPPLPRAASAPSASAAVAPGRSSILSYTRRLTAAASVPIVAAADGLAKAPQMVLTAPASPSTTADALGRPSQTCSGVAAGDAKRVVKGADEGAGSAPRRQNGRAASGSGNAAAGGGNAAAAAGGKGVSGGRGPGSGKAAVIESLRQRHGDGSACMSQKVAARVGPCIRLAPAATELLGRLQRLYFLGEGPAADMGRFLATDRGVIRYPRYTIRRSGSAFGSRQQLLEYEQALQHAARLEECLEAGDEDGAAAALAPALAAVASGAAQAVRWAGDATVPVRAVPGPWPWEDHPPAQPLPPLPPTAAARLPLPPHPRDAKGGCDELGPADGRAVCGAEGRQRGCGCSASAPAVAAVAAAAAVKGRTAARGTGASRRDSVDLTLSSDSDSGAGEEEGQEGEGSGPSTGQDGHSHGGSGGFRGCCVGAARPGAADSGVTGSTGDQEAGLPPDSDGVDGTGGYWAGLGVAPGAAGCRGSQMRESGSRAPGGGGYPLEAERAGFPPRRPDRCEPQRRDGGDRAADEGATLYGADGCMPCDDGSHVYGDDDVVYGDELEDGPGGAASPPGAACEDAPGAAQGRGAAGPGQGTVRDEAVLGGEEQPPLPQQLHARLGQGQEGQPHGQSPAHPFLARFCAAWVYASMGTVGVSLLERQRRYPEAVALLRSLLRGRCCPGRRGEWWTRMSLDLQHLGREEEALQVAEAALTDPWVRHGDRLSLQRRVLRLGRPPRRWRRPAWAEAALAEPREVVVSATMLRGATGFKSRFIVPHAAKARPPSDGDLPGGATAADGPGAHGAGGPDAAAGGDGTVGVEELALLHYRSPAGGGWRGVHSEGGVWGTLWGLLMWDVLFADVPEVFRSPFQTAPLDLDTDAFLPSRRELVDARLQAIAGGAAPELLRGAWSAHEGTWARGVNWERQPLEELLEIARCVGGLGLSVVCRLLCEDCAGWRGGMPDLLLWRPERGDAMVSEVKGPRDRLSDQQRAWMAALAAAEVRAEVLRVVEAAPGEAEGGGGGHSPLH